MKKVIFLIFLVLTLGKSVFACDSAPRKINNDDIGIWLGKKSNLSKVYEHGKCALDQVLGALPIEQRIVIANLIAKSYANSKKKLKETSTYNY